MGFSIPETQRGPRKCGAEADWRGAGVDEWAEDGRGGRVEGERSRVCFERVCTPGRSVWLFLWGQWELSKALHQDSSTIPAMVLSGNCQACGGRIHAGRRRTESPGGRVAVGLPGTNLDPRVGLFENPTRLFT